jgi:hypothetical protein
MDLIQSKVLNTYGFVNWLLYHSNYLSCSALTCRSSDETRNKGLRELTDQGLLDVARRPVPRRPSTSASAPGMSTWCAPGRGTRARGGHQCRTVLRTAFPRPGTSRWDRRDVSAPIWPTTVCPEPDTALVGRMSCHAAWARSSAWCMTRSIAAGCLSGG